MLTQPPTTARPARITIGTVKTLEPKYGLDTAALAQGFAGSALRQQLQQRLGLPTQQAPAQAPPTGGTAQTTPQQPPDPKKQVIEGLIKGLFGN